MRAMLVTADKCGPGTYPAPRRARAKIPQMQVTQAPASCSTASARCRPRRRCCSGWASRPGVYLVGGAVRDLLMGGEPADLDLVVEGDAAQLAARLGGRLRVHDRFGTSTVELDGHTYDIARARQETYARPGALPDVTPATLDEDLLRRDFTVNAMAIALTGPRRGRAARGSAGTRGSRAGHAARASRAQLHRRPDAIAAAGPLHGAAALRRRAAHARARRCGDPRARAANCQRRSDRSRAAVAGARARPGRRLRDPPRAVGSITRSHPDFGLDDPESVRVARVALALAPAGARRDRLVLAAAARGLAAARLHEAARSTRVRGR